MTQPNERKLVPQRLRKAANELENGVTVTDKSLAAEVVALAAEMSHSMEELRSIGASRIASEDIPTATDELDAIVDVTAKATGSILDACEEIESTIETLSDAAAADRLSNATTEIYQACNFQDLTGQRISKIVGTLKSIDRRVTAICAVFGLDPDLEPQNDDDDVDLNDDARLLNGPALPADAMSQDDIDRILADMD